MPQFDRLQEAFSDDPNFRAVLAMVYSDILEFHRRAYKMFRKRCECFFQGILKNIARHQDLLIKEVFTIDVVAARQWRTKTEEELIRQEKKSRDYYLHDSIAWLKVADEQQDDELTRLCEKRQKGTCEWVFKNELFQVWKDDPHGDPILWVKGIPGAGEKIVYKVQMLILIKPQGKTILSTYIIHRFQEESA